MSKGARARKRDRRSSGGEGARTETNQAVEPEESSGGGFLIGLRGGMKAVAGSGERKDARRPGAFSKVLDWLLWGAVAAAIVLFVLKRWHIA